MYVCVSIEESRHFLDTCLVTLNNLSVYVSVEQLKRVCVCVYRRIPTLSWHLLGHIEFDHICTCVCSHLVSVLVERIPKVDREWMARPGGPVLLFPEVRHFGDPKQVFFLGPPYRDGPAGTPLVRLVPELRCETGHRLPVPVGSGSF
mgnify:CR=1 FL=1